jgi:hypothetical protein
VHLEILNGIQNAQNYRDLLIRVKPIIERTMDGLPWVFQHDNAAVHTARLVSSWLEEENINVLEWPSVSPDLNILSNVWGWFFRQLYGNGQQYPNVGQPTNAIQAAWNTVTQGYTWILYLILFQIESLKSSAKEDLTHTININFLVVFVCYFICYCFLFLFYY